MLYRNSNNNLKRNIMKAITLNTKEQELFDFCIKMGDSEKLAYEAVLIERKKYESYEFYDKAYTN